MKRSRRGKIVRFLAAILAILVAGLSYYLVTRPRSLLDGAMVYRAVSPAKSYGPISVLRPSSVPITVAPAPRNSAVHAPTLAWSDYVWLNDNTIRTIDSSIVRQLRDIDVKTGAVKRCVIPSKSGIQEWITLDTLSPDGHWITADVSVLSPLKVGSSVAPTISREILQIDGKRRIPLSAKLQEFIWRSDSKGWLRHARFGVPTGVGTIDPPRERPVRMSSTPGTPIWYKDDRARGISLRNNSFDRLDWKETDLRTGKTQAIVMPLPARTAFSDCRFSPDGKQVLWELGLQPSWLDRAFGWIGVRRSNEILKSVALFVSNADGSDMRLIGTAPPKFDPARDALMARWLPDSRHISFIYAGRFYSLPVP